MISFPNCKINLGLNILSRRIDGYHEIESLMIPVAWCDILEIVPAVGEESTLTVTGRTVDCPTEKNLVMKAYRLMEAIYGIPPVEIHLHKVIPDGAGLGGGSSDAAFTLSMLNNMFALGLENEQLAELAAQLGADCPFFIYNMPMMATGIGTILTPGHSPLYDYRIVIVKPNVYVSTKEAYAGVTPRHPEIPLSEAIENEDFSHIHNDFEPSVFAAHPEIKEVKDRLLEMGARYASMSGSGSSVFGIFTPESLPDDLAAKFPGMDVFG